MVYVGFSTPKLWNPLSWAIRKATRARTSHAWLLVEDPLFQQRLVLEAAGAGFRLVSFSRFLQTERLVTIVELPHTLEPALPAAGEWLGEKFDLVGLVGMAWVVAGQLLGRLWRNPFRSRRSLFCSESVVRTLRAAGFPGSGSLRMEDTTPAALLAFLSYARGATLIRSSDLVLSGLTRPQRRDLRRRARPDPESFPGPREGGGRRTVDQPGAGACSPVDGARRGPLAG